MTICITTLKTTSILTEGLIQDLINSKKQNIDGVLFLDCLDAKVSSKSKVNKNG